MQRLALLLGAIALVPTASACGYATDMIYTPAAGVNDRDGDIDVLNAAIVSTEGGTGRFITTLTNNDQTQAGSLEEMMGAGEDGQLNVGGFEPIEVPAGGLVNLAVTQTEGGVGIPVEGEFELGEFIAVSLTFGDGRSTSLEVPVLPNAGDYAGISGSTESDLERPDPPETFLLEPEDEGEPEGTTVPETVPEEGIDSEEAE